jgi:hypothetical protein
MNIDGRLAELNKKLQEQVKAKDTAMANIHYLHGAIDVLNALKQDAEQPITELQTEPEQST